MRRLAPVAACVLTAAALTVSAATASPSTPPADDGLYVVVLRSEPAAIFTGSADLRATAPTMGHRFHAGSAAARAYAEFLWREQRSVQEASGVTAVVYSYRTAVNGFAAELTSAQVKSLMADPDVVSVQLSQTLRLDQVGPSTTSASTEDGDLTLLRTAKAWRAVDGVGRAGRGVVIGVVDSGIWPDNPSFSAPPLDRSSLRRSYPGFSGDCQPGDRWSESTCTTKIIAARYFVAGFGADNVSSAEFLSPRDATGHGSHVAAIAAGNSGVDVTIDRQGFGHISGVAPTAALSVYKACWAAPDPTNDGCTTADTIAAIDQAVSDGVDVLNFSASGSSAWDSDAVELAFLTAASAGVFVTTPAGNDGPRPGTVAHVSPWVTTVASSTQTLYQGGVRLGNGRLIVGSMVADQRVSKAPLVKAAAANAAGSHRAEAAVCEPGSLDARLVARAIVVCERGVISRVSKSAAVAQAGGVGMVLVNNASGGTDTDVHAVPTVHVTRADGRAIEDYIAHSAHPEALLDPSAADHTPVPQLADYSGRGPAFETGADTVKPDVTAPGVGIVSAVSPTSDEGRLWDLYSGTSMAAAQVGGLAALVEAAHPDWSAAAVKSAILTTAAPLADDSGPLARGAGDIRADRALDPGIVYDATRHDWLQNLRASSTTFANLWGSSTRDPSDLNQPSIAIGSLVGRQTVTRRVTNVSGGPETYTARIRGVPGIAVRVAPSTLRLSPGETARYRVTFTAQRAAPYGEFTTGELRWTGSAGHVATSPIVVRPETISVPDDIRSLGSDGGLQVRGVAGVTGILRTLVAGPIAAEPESISVPVGSFDTRLPDSSTATAQHYLVDGGTAVTRFEIDAASEADVDLYVYRDGRLVAAGASTSSHEVVTLEQPKPGSYDVYIVAPARSDLAEADGSEVDAVFTGWIVPRRPAGHFEVARRTPVTGAETVDLPLSWSGLSESQRWFGELRFDGSSQVTHITLN